METDAAKRPLTDLNCDECGVKIGEHRHAVAQAFCSKHGPIDLGPLNEMAATYQRLNFGELS